MTLRELKERFIRGAEEFSILIQPVFFASNHLVSTKKGMKIPNCSEIQQNIVGLAESLKDGYESASSGGIELQVEYDEDDNILDGNICYVANLSSLLGEEIDEPLLEEQMIIKFNEEDDV